MSDLHGTFPGYEPAPADPAPQPTPEVAVAPAGDGVAAEGAGADGFDRSRVLRLLDRLERDIAAVETAMVHVEAGEHEAYIATVAALEPQLVD